MLGAARRRARARPVRRARARWASRRSRAGRATRHVRRARRRARSRSIRANLEALGLGDDEAAWSARPARAALRDASARGDAYDLVFLDPPYRRRAGAGTGALAGAARRAGARRAGRDRERPPRAAATSICPSTDERRYGDTLIRIHAPWHLIHRIAVCPGLLRPDHQRPPRRHRARVAALRRGHRRRRQPSGAQEQDALRRRGALRVHRGGDRAPGQRPRRAVRHPRRRLRARVGARAIVKGLRAISDFEYELEMNQLNRLQAPDIESLYLMASPAVQFPQLERRQGDRDLRWRHRRSRARAGRRGA